jgi:cation diffusion facilitator family transporter
LIYAVTETVAAFIFGSMSDSISLIGFALDSGIESLSAIVMIWRFSQVAKRTSEQDRKREHLAIRLVGVTFFPLAAYVAYESIEKILTQEGTHAQPYGIAVALVSIITMPILFSAKQKVGKNMKSKSLLADSKQTLACVVLAIALLIGLLVQNLFGWWYADPLVGLLIAAYLVTEGWRTVKEGELCAC